MPIEETAVMVWWIVNEGVDLGYLPAFLVPDDPRPAKEQFNERYVYGGFEPFKGFFFDPRTHRLQYPGDPPMFPLGGTTLRDETILLFPSSWVVILQRDGAWECARMD